MSPTPRFLGSVSRVPASRPSGAAVDLGDKITTEVVEGTAPAGRYLIRGAATPTRTPLSLKVGDLVSVLWRGGKPFMILNLAQRHGPGTDEPTPGGPVIEELFVEQDPETGEVDVWFRNADQLTRLHVNKTVAVSVDPTIGTLVFWGAAGDRFLVQDYFVLGSSTLYVFKLNRVKDRAYQARAASAKFEYKIKVSDLDAVGSGVSLSESYPAFITDGNGTWQVLTVNLVVNFETIITTILGTPPVPQTELSFGTTSVQYTLLLVDPPCSPALDGGWKINFTPPKPVLQVGSVSVLSLPLGVLLDDRGHVIINYLVNFGSAVIGYRYFMNGTTEECLPLGANSCGFPGVITAWTADITARQILLAPGIISMEGAIASPISTLQQQPIVSGTTTAVDLTLASLVLKGQAVGKIRSIVVATTVQGVFFGPLFVGIYGGATTVLTYQGVVLHGPVATSVLGAVVFDPGQSTLTHITWEHPITEEIFLTDVKKLVTKKVANNATDYGAAGLVLLRPDFLYAASEDKDVDEKFKFHYIVNGWNRKTGEILLSSDNIASPPKDKILSPKVVGLKSLKLKTGDLSQNFPYPPDPWPGFPGVSIQLVNDVTVLGPLSRFFKE